jgi:hypothetical protein
MKRTVLPLIFLLLSWLPMIGEMAQDTGEPVSLHVKEVHRTEEDTDYGFMTHITAVVESKTVAYSIKCDETFSREKHGYTGRCFAISAGKDYSARKFPDAINFWPPQETGQGYVLILYDIISEKEK